jgi:hypothetical protein
MSQRLTRILAALALAAFSAVAPVRAGRDVDFGANAGVGDANVFFSISSRYFDRDVRVVQDWNRRFPQPDDLAVALHLARHCDRGPEFFASLRRAGVGWFEISNRCNVAPDVFFVDVDREPGPPYGKAYGYWKKHKRDPKARFVLTDRQVRDLVAVRMAHEYYGVPVNVAMDWRRGGRDVGFVMVSQYHARHGKGRAGEGHGKRGGESGGKGKGSKEKKGKGGKH